MLKGLFNNSKYLNNGKNSLYKIVNNQFVALDEELAKGSVNDVTEYIGYNLDQINTVFTLDSKITECIGFKILTKEPVFVWLKEKTVKMNFKILQKQIEQIDWSFEYDSHRVDEILQQGVENKSLSFEYINTLVNLEKESDNIYLSKDLRLYLTFKNGYLEQFTSSDWLSSSSKWLQEVNKTMFENMVEEARSFHDTDYEVMEEVNIQCSALQEIPYALKNEFISHHIKPNGNINFYNLLAAHYNDSDNSEITLERFEIVNKGRIVGQGNLSFEVDSYIYSFNDDGKLISAIQK